MTNSKTLDNFYLISQRDYKGDHDHDGKLDAYQTCNIHACQMVIRFITGKNITPLELDQTVRTEFGSRYNHSNLIRLLELYGVKSDFGVSVSHDKIKNHLSKNLPVIWSNKITHGGHIVCVTGFDNIKKAYRIHDSYGEPLPTNSDRTTWKYEDRRMPYWLSYKSFDVVNANGFNYHKCEHWAHLCSKL